MAPETDPPASPEAPAPPDLPEPPWRSVPRRSAPRPQLTRPGIVEAALRVVDRDGAEGLTMRRVADELGAGAASLYGYVANKEELVLLVIDELFREIPVPERGTAADWQDQVKDFMRQARAMFQRHPGTAALTLGRIPIGPNFLVRSEALLGSVRSAGLPDWICAFAGDLLGLYVGAFAYEESLAASVDKQVAQFAEWMASLPADRFPNTAALAPLMTQGGTDERFEWGLDVIIRGLASYAEPGVG